MLPFSVTIPTFIVLCWFKLNQNAKLLQSQNFWWCCRENEFVLFPTLFRFLLDFWFCFAGFFSSERQREHNSSGFVSCLWSRTEFSHSCYASFCVKTVESILWLLFSLALLVSSLLEVGGTVPKTRWHECTVGQEMAV